MSNTASYTRDEQASANDNSAPPTAPDRRRSRRDSALSPAARAVINEARQIMLSTPKGADAEEIVHRLEAVKRLIQDSGIKVARSGRGDFGTVLFVMVLDCPEPSTQAKELMHEIIQLITPEESHRPNLGLQPLPELTDEEATSVVAGQNAEDNE